MTRGAPGDAATPSSSLRRLLGLLRPHRGALVVVALVSAVALASGLATPELVKRLIDDAIVARRRGRVWPLGLGALALGTLRPLANVVRRNLIGATGARVEADLRSRLFGHLQGLPVSFHHRWQSGQLLARATSDVEAIGSFLGYPLVFLAYGAIQSVALATVLVVLDRRLAGLTLALLAGFGFGIRRFNRRMEPLAAGSRQANAEVTSRVQEAAIGIRVVKSFGQEDQVVGKVDHAAARLRDVHLDGVRVRSVYVPGLTLVTNLVVAAVLGLGGAEVIAHRLTLGGLVAFNQYLAVLLLPLRSLGFYLPVAQQALAAAPRVFEILDTQPAVADHPHARPLPPVIGEVRFEHVSFAYPSSGSPALQDVCFTVEPGETVALAGSSGSGKSTVAALLPRFLEPTDGRVLVDGVDVSSVTLASLRRQMGVVFDEPVLFRGSVRDNIAFGDPDADDEEVRRAAVAAGAHEFVSRLPAGYQTVLGDQGVGLSGGQRQRLALARALLSRPRILVLDDPLSSVDVHTQAEIEANLASLRRGRTVILIAHRASTMALADRVLLLEQGRLVAGGTHRELLADPRYRRLHLGGGDADTGRWAFAGEAR